MKVLVLGSRSGSAPAYATYRDDSTVGANIALCIDDSLTGQRLFCSPGPARVCEDELAWMREADCLLLDGSLDAALETRLALDADNADDADHAQAPPEPVGTMSANMMDLLNRLPSRKVLAHLATESPWLDERGAAARRSLQRQGIELAHDGMEIEL